MEDQSRSKDDLITELHTLRQRLRIYENIHCREGDPGRTSEDLILFRSFFHESQDGMALVSEEGEFLEINPAFSKLLGYVHDELLSKNASSIWADPQDRSDWRALMDDKGAVKDFEALMRKKDGAVIHCLVTSTRITCGAGTVQYQTVLRDISEKKKAESRLREALDLNQKIFSSSPIGIVTYGPDGECTSANDAAGALIGANLDQVLSQNFHQLESWKESGLLHAAEEALHSGEPTQRMVHLVTSFGRDVWLDCRFARFLSGDQLHLLLCFSDVTDLKQAEEESGALFRKYFDLGRIGMAITSPEKGWVRVNDQICVMLGYSRKELANVTWADITHPEDLAPDVAQFERLMTGEIDSYSMDKRFIRKDGTIVYTALHVSCIRGTEGKVENVIAHLEDITDRKRSETELIARTRDLQEIVKELNALYEISKLAEKPDITLHELVQGIVDIIPNGWHYPELTCARASFEDKIYTSINFVETASKTSAELIADKERVGHLEVFVMDDRLEPGQKPFIPEEESLLREIGDRLSAEIETRRREAEILAYQKKLATRDRIAEIFLTVPDDEMYWQVLQVLLENTGSEYGVFGYVNEHGDLVCPSMTRHVWAECQVSDKNIVYPREQWGGIWGRCLVEKRPIFENKDFNVPEGHVPINRSIAVPIVHQNEVVGLLNLANKDGDYSQADVEFLVEKAGYLAPILDARLTRDREALKRKRAEEELLRRTEEIASANKELEHFAYVASHDLREPLRKISNFTGLLAKRYGGALDEKADNYIHYIVDGADRMQKLIEDLLFYSRVGRAEISSDLTNAEVVLQQTLSDLSPMLEESGAEVSHGPLPYVRMNASQLGRLFQNLIGNAVKFRGDLAPKIHVSAVKEGEKWVLSVQDSGIGFDASQSERIFGIFQRLHARDEYPGTGIGLAVCKKTVERHGGRIWAESEPGKGATFYFVVPGE